jgi:glycerol kinase
MSVLVVDAGTSSVRAGVVQPDGSLVHVHAAPVPPATPAPGFVELDAAALAEAALEVANAALAEAGRVAAVGIANQRATTVVWERGSGQPVAPAVGWQDLRTVVMCLSLRAQGIALAPNQSATKLAFLLDTVDPERRRDLCFGTIDTWLAFVLSEGSLHVTDATNAAVTGLVRMDGTLRWDEGLLEALRIPPAVLPSIVDSSGVLGEARALPGLPPIAALVGDQQASLVGQGCTRPGLAKATFGTGGMVDLCTGARPAFERRGPQGTFPIVAFQRHGRPVHGLEAIMLTAGSALAWLCDDLGVLGSPGESEDLAASVPDAGDVVFVPALSGLGTPVWDFGARGVLLGLDLGTTRATVVRAVLEGIAHRGADLLEAAEADSGMTVPTVRVDGGMSANRTFLQALADATGRPVEAAPVLEATTLGAGYLAGLAVGTWRDEDEIASMWRPRLVVHPARRLDRDRWREARERARRVVPELSELEF